jgi:demethylmenaquinone methyltransferase/2-methoxy-6-polyprenyl-1,4-benzoquinol methylase
MHGTGDVRFFDRIAGLYDLAMASADRAPLDAGLDRADRPIEVVLDLGGGTGRAARALGGDVDAVVVDRSRGMLRKARTGGLSTVQADARRLPFPDGSVDAITVVDALHHMPDHDRVLAEAARVLRPGGVLVVREFDPSTLPGRALVAAERLVGFGSTFATPDALAAAVRRAGLRPEVVERGFGYTVAGVKGTSQ